jgi:hypothetical protein
MGRIEAERVARIFDGEASYSGDGVWLVLIPLESGALRVISGDMDCVYADREAFERGDEPGDVHILR